MITNFALSLSLDGIQLLQRADDGWLLVGNTPLDVPDLGAALADLREDAMRLAPDGMRTKILIPNEQIKYITLENAQTSLADVRTALTGTTPYPIDELVIDFERNGGRTFIAAVARETLEEAEEFAEQYEFAPVCFAAIAEPDTFRTEVFFGPTKAKRGAVARDATPVTVIGNANFSAQVVDEVEEIPIDMDPPRMADPESVAQPDLAVPTGQADGPAIPPPDTGTPPAPHKPVTVNVPKPPKIASGTLVLAAPQAKDMAATGGFASRRTAPAIEAAAQTTTDTPADAISSQQAKTKRSKPRFLGLILTLILLAVMALVAIWASSLSDEDLANWFGYTRGDAVEVAAPVPDTEETQVIAALPQADDAPVAAAVPEETPLPQLRATELGRVLSPAEADRIYAATGVWQRAPRLPLEPRSDTLEAPIPQSEPPLAALRRPDLPTTTMSIPDLALIAPNDPPAAGTVFQRDADGFVLATPTGAVTPQGALVFTGAPSKRPPPRPQATALDQPELDAAQEEEQPPVATFTSRPALRPEDLVPPIQEVALVDPALAGVRPKPRPAGLAPVSAPEPEPQTPAVPDITSVIAAIAEAAPASPYVTPTARAVRVSERPDPRPRNFDRVVKRATDLAAQQAARQQASAQPAAAVSNAPARSSGAVPGGVANAATLENAIKLRNVNLIGVYGRPNNRRALVRLGNGRYVKVEVGSSLDGGRVTAIGDSALNYTKRGKTIALQLPSG